MRRLWLLVFALLVLIDVAILPTIVLAIVASSVLTTRAGPSLASILVAAAIATGLVWLTLVVGRTWRRSSPTRADCAPHEGPSADQPRY